MLCINQLNGFGAGSTSVLTSGTPQSNSSTTLGTGYLETALTCTVGRSVVTLCAADNAGTNGVSSLGQGRITLGGSVTYYAATVHATQDPGAANAGVTVWAGLQLNTALLATQPGVEYTATTSKALLVFEVWDTAGGGLEVVDSGSGVNNGTTPSITTALPLKAGDLMIAFIAQEARIAPSTPDAGFTTQQSAIADTTVVGTSVVISYQTYVATTDLANRNYALTLNVARDYAIGYIVLRALD